MSREEALRWADSARTVRHAVRDQLASGELTLARVIERARIDELTGAVRLGWVLESLPGARKVDTRRRLEQLGLDGSRALAELDDDALGTVLESFGAAGAVGAAGAAGAVLAPEGVADDVPPLPEGASVVVISGPGGVGKGTLVAELLRRDPALWLSRSWTTRARRVGESPDAYHFARPEEFLDRARSGGFLEWTTFLDYQQGSPVPEPPAGHDVLFEIDVRGAANVKRLYPDALLVFVDAPDRETQEARLRGRGDDEQRVRQRIEKAAEEVELAATMDFVHVVNDELDRTVAELESLIAAHRSR